MTNKLDELLTLLRESVEGEDLEKPESLDKAKEPGAEANGEVPPAEAKSDTEKARELEAGVGSEVLPEAEEVQVAAPEVQPQVDGSGGEISADAEVSADELAAEVDPEIAEIIRLMGEAEENSEEKKDEEKSDSEKKEDSSEDSSEKKEDKDEEKSEDPASSDYNEVDNVAISDDEAKDIADKAVESGEKSEEKAEEAPLPGSEDLSPEQRGCLRRLFDSKVNEGVRAALPKAIKLAEATLAPKYRAAIVAREQKLNEQVSHYLKYVVESWMKKNQPAHYTAAQIKVAKKIFESVKSLVEMFDIETVDSTASLIEMYEGRLSKLEKDANKLISENADLVKEITIRDRALIIQEAAKGLPLTEVAKFKKSASAIKADDLATFKENVETLKSSFGAAKPKQGDGVKPANENLALQGGLNGQKPAPRTDAEMIASLLPTGSESNK